MGPFPAVCFFDDVLPSLVASAIAISQYASVDVSDLFVQKLLCAFIYIYVQMDPDLFKKYKQISEFRL